MSLDTECVFKIFNELFYVNVQSNDIIDLYITRFLFKSSSIYNLYFSHKYVAHHVNFALIENIKYKTNEVTTMIKSNNASCNDLIYSYICTVGKVLENQNYIRFELYNNNFYSDYGRI